MKRLRPRSWWLFHYWCPAHFVLFWSKKLGNAGGGRKERRHDTGVEGVHRFCLFPLFSRRLWKDRGASKHKAFVRWSPFFDTTFENLHLVLRWHWRYCRRCYPSSCSWWHNASVRNRREQWSLSHGLNVWTGRRKRKDAVLCYTRLNFRNSKQVISQEGRVKHSNLRGSRPGSLRSPRWHVMHDVHICTRVSKRRLFCRHAGLENPPQKKRAYAVVSASVGHGFSRASSSTTHREGVNTTWNVSLHVSENFFAFRPGGPGP